MSTVFHKIVQFELHILQTLLIRSNKLIKVFVFLLKSIDNICKLPFLSNFTDIQPIASNLHNWMSRRGQDMKAEARSLGRDQLVVKTEH